MSAANDPNPTTGSTATYIGGPALTEIDMMMRALAAEKARDARTWNQAIAAAEEAVRHCAAIDSNGYICEKSAAITAIRSAGRD